MGESLSGGETRTTSVLLKAWTPGPTGVVYSSDAIEKAVADYNARHRAGESALGEIGGEHRGCGGDDADAADIDKKAVVKLEFAPSGAVVENDGLITQFELRGIDLVMKSPWQTEK